MIHDSLRKLTRGTFPGGVELFRQMCGSVGAGRPTLTPAEAHPHITARHVPGNNLRIAYLHTQLSCAHQPKARVQSADLRGLS